MTTTAPANAAPRYGSVRVGNVDVFYREAGPVDAPVLLALHGFPTSSHMYRALLNGLGHRWRVIAPDYPGFGQSSMPAMNDFTYGFAAYADVIEQFSAAIGLTRYALYVQDYGGPVGFRLAARHPDRVTGLIIQNANAYEEGFGPLFDPIRSLWERRDEEREAAVLALFKLDIKRFQYLEGATDPSRISPDTWSLDQYYMDRPGNDRIQLELQYDYRNNPPEYARWQRYFREHEPPTLIVWGRNDPFFTVAGAQAYLRDLPRAELHFFDGGHFVLEEHARRIVPIIDAFLEKLPAPTSP